ncbi:MAG: hypothetical protein UZ22_OP11002000932 [Microgenomates bacterium OLB23]|nr:MAG: hypothetical protein UZ22_OP11002000932 [Microgenomates bacterium OLB23]
MFNTTTGTFELNAVGLSQPFGQLKTIADIRPALTNYLQNTLGIIDETTTLGAYYQRSTTPDITYYEFHRDPEKVGLQIINPVGVANLPEDVPLKKVAINEFTVDSANDPTIIIASDTPGKARRSDFNTMTVGINNSGAIVSIESNLRPIETSDYIANLSLFILSPDQALEELQKQGAYYSISVPSGQGTIDYDQVYAENQLKTNEAVITDMALSFIEKPARVAQRYLQPVYIVRGYAETSTGVRVKFVQTVPAVSALEETAMHFSPAAYAAEIAIPCPDGSGTCTFETFKNTPTPAQATGTPIPTTGISVTSPPPTSNRCILRNSAGEVIEEGRPLFVPGIGDVFYFANLPTGPLVVPNSFTDPSSNEGIDAAAITSYAFEERIQNELITLGARIMRDDPSRISYGSNGLDLKRLYGLTTDIQNLADVTYGNGVSERAIYWDTIANELYLNRNDLNRMLNNPTPLHDAGLSNETIWMSRRNAHQFGATSRNYNNFVLDSRCKFLTTISPLVYFYPVQSSNITFTFNHPHTTYVDPILKESLSFRADVHGNLNFGALHRDKLHYEYSGVRLSRPAHGWLINVANIQLLTQHVGAQLQLNAREQDGLLKEVGRATTGMSNQDQS